MNQELVFIKLGGSLITDKRKRETPRVHVIKSIAEEIRNILDDCAKVNLLLGHGSGSYGHWEAHKYDTRTGVSTLQQWQGFARVSAAASRLNRLVVDIFLEADVPVLSLQPSASIDANAGEILNYNTLNIQRCLQHKLIPFVYGDIAFDKMRGGTILSTEDLFSFLTPILKPTRIILLGNAPGVFNNQGQVISKITPVNYPEVAKHLYGSRYTDVTGGMADKVNRMVGLVKLFPNLKVQIMSGIKSGNLIHAMMDTTYSLGTVICSS